MLTIQAIVICACVASISCADLLFPPGFMFGVASASYQVEGAWNVSDKSENIWDRFIHDDPDRIAGRVTGDVACDSYHLWQRDIEMIEEIGAHFYRFSISWPRLLPSGLSDRISEDGRDYYNNLIDGLLARGIEPIITIYHWDLPQRLQELGGWINPLIVDWFGDYARVAYTLFGDRVQRWLTINEPVAVCDLPYNSGIVAPGVLDPDMSYVCNKNLLLAHARAYRIYDEEFRAMYNGSISMANHAFWIGAETPEDEELAELARENLVGRYVHPVYTQEGGWPPALEQYLHERSLQEGLPRSKLPPFTQEEIEYVRGTFDYFGLNYYTSRLVRAARPGDELGYWPFYAAPDLDAVLGADPSWTSTVAFWYYLHPEGFRMELNRLKQEYGDMEILITENGFPTNGGLDDVERINFYTDHMEQVNLAIKDGVNVVGYTAWTLMDNFEWIEGYNSQFGLYQVDFDSEERTRTPRASANFYRQVIEDNNQ